MPYTPGVAYQSGNIAAGIVDLGKSFQNAMERRKREASEAAALRKLGAVYDPENKERFATMGLNELRAEAAAFGASRQKQMEDSRLKTEEATRANLTADNNRAEEFLKLQRQAQGRMETADAARKGFAKDFASGPPMVLRPDLLADYAGPAGRFRYALGRNPGALDPASVDVLARYAAASEDPNAAAIAAAKVLNAENGAGTSRKDPTLTRDVANIRRSIAKESLAFRKHQEEMRSIQKELENLLGQKPEVVKRRKELMDRLDVLRTALGEQADDGDSGDGSAPAAPAAGAPAAGVISFDGLENWRKARK